MPIKRKEREPYYTIREKIAALLWLIIPLKAWERMFLVRENNVTVFFNASLQLVLENLSTRMAFIE
jgi:hypothetical protein